MGKNKKQEPRFSASKRDFLKKTALLGVYIGPVIRSFEMAEITAKATGPPKNKKKTGKKTKGSARLQGLRGKRDLA